MRFCLYCCLAMMMGHGLPLAAQTNLTTITGVVTYQVADGPKQPMPAGVSVFIAGITSPEMTDSNGSYSLDISHCSACIPGSELTIHVNSKEFGYHERRIILPKGQGGVARSIDLHVIRNNRLALTGMVRDYQTGNFLSGIQVSALVNGWDKEIPQATTDARGFFQIVLESEGAANLNTATFTCVDPNGTYGPTQEIKYLNRYEPVTIELEPAKASAVSTARRLLTEEILANAQKLDDRLQFFDTAIALFNFTDYDREFDSLQQAVRPAKAQENSAGYQQLILQSNLNTLQPNLNSVALNQEFGASFLQNVLTSQLEEARYVELYRQQLKEVQRAEESLMGKLSDIAQRS